MKNISSRKLIVCKWKKIRGRIKGKNDWTMEIAPILAIITILLLKKSYFIDIIMKNIEIIILVAMTITISTIITVKLKNKNKVFIGLNGLRPVYLDLSGNKHIVIFGMTGSGKTETAKRILKSVNKKKLIIDWSGEYTDYKSIEPSELKIDLKKEDIIDAIISTFQLTIPQQTLLIEASKRGGGLKEIIEEIKKINYQSDSGREVKDALIRKLSILEKLNLFNGNKNLAEVEAINLSKITFEAKKLVTNIILKSFYNNPEPRILVIEEAQNIMPRQNQETINVTELIINEIRKYGVNVILIAQTPSQISNVYRNAEYVIIHRLRLTHHEIQELGLKMEEAEKISKLNLGECIIISGGEKREVRLIGVKGVIKNISKIKYENTVKDEIERINIRNLEEDYEIIKRKVIELEENYKQLIEKYRRIEKVKIAENPISLGEFIDRTEDKLVKISTSISILKDKMESIEEKTSKNNLDKQNFESIIGKIEKQTITNSNRIIELERRIDDILDKMKRFEYWVKEVISQIEDRIR